MDSKNHIDLELLQSLHRYLDGELSEQERRAVEEELRRRPDVAAEFQQMKRMRSRVQDAVKGQSAPERLRDSVPAVTDAKSLQIKSPRSFPVWGWSAIAACVLLIVGFFAWSTLPDESASSENERIAERVERNRVGMDVDEVLAIGVTDHIRCAVTYYEGKTPHYSETQMRETLGADFADLLSVVQSGLQSGEIVVAHHCSFEGRKYVHMILHVGDDMLSYIMTRKREGESYDNASESARTIGSRAVYSGSVEGYTVAGFETRDYFVFLASELEPEQNVVVISGLLPGTAAHLQNIAA